MLTKRASSTDSGGLRLRSNTAGAEPSSLDTDGASLYSHAAGASVSLAAGVVFAFVGHGIILGPHALRCPAGPPAHADHGGGRGARLGNCPGPPWDSLGQALVTGEGIGG